MRTFLRLALALMICTACAQPLVVRAHADLEERIAALDVEIEAHPGDAELYLKRGELHRLHHDWQAALADYRRAESIDPSHPHLPYFRGRMWREAGEAARALAELDRFLSATPDHPDALISRARAHAQLGDPLAGAADLDQAIALLAEPTPELYLECARLFLEAGSEYGNRAAFMIDRGILRLGPVASLVAFSADNADRTGAAEAALGHLGAVPPALAEQPAWLARRARLLELTERFAEARAARDRALAAIENLPPSRRTAEPMQALEKDLRRWTPGTRGG